MTDEAKFTGLAGGEILAPAQDGGKMLAPVQDGAGCESFAFVRDGDDPASFFAAADADGGSIAESGEGEGSSLPASPDEGAIVDPKKNDGDHACFGRGTVPLVIAAGQDEDSLAEMIDGSGADEGRRGRCLGVRMKRAGQIFFYPDDTLPVRTGSKVIVEFEQKTAFGEVESIIFNSPSAQAGAKEQHPPGKIIGLATARDIALHAENRILADEVTAFCATCIRQRSLDMKLVDVEVLHDRSKIIFYFTAPARIDFRELVKDLVRNYRTRIELRQIGVRHETQMVGGIGNCGMVCCCHQYLRKFAPVTIKMAKEQNLFLNPAKLSGMCGRLLCCLSFEQSNYEGFNRRCPKLGKRYVTGSGTYRIMRVNMFSRSIVVSSDEGEEKELTLDEWEAITPRRAEPLPPDIVATQARRHSGDDGRGGRSRGRNDRVEESNFSEPEAEGCDSENSVLDEPEVE